MCIRKIHSNLITNHTHNHVTMSTPLNEGLTMTLRVPTSDAPITATCPTSYDGFCHLLNQGVNPLSLFLLMFGRTITLDNGTLRLVVPISTKRVLSELAQAYGTDRLRPVVDDLVLEIFSGLTVANPIGLLIYRIRSACGGCMGV